MSDVLIKAGAKIVLPLPATRAESSGCSFQALSAAAQPGRLVLVAPKAQCPEIRKIALPAALRHRPDVVGVPKAPPAGMHVQSAPQLSSLACRQPLKSTKEFDGVQTADRTDSPVSCLYPFAQIPGICSQPPLVNAGIATECSPSFWDFLAAPPADSSAVRPPFQSPSNPTSWFRSFRAHKSQGKLASRLTCSIFAWVRTELADFA
jgi:hypothetical protein